MKYTLTEFLDTVKVIKMLYGRDIAETFFKKNIDNFPGLTYDDLSESINKQES